eukprot:762656-Hanusia_phi.AAC.3
MSTQDLDLQADRSVRAISAIGDTIFFGGNFRKCKKRPTPPPPHHHHHHFYHHLCLLFLLYFYKLQLQFMSFPFSSPRCFLPLRCFAQLLLFPPPSLLLPLCRCSLTRAAVRNQTFSHAAMWAGKKLLPLGRGLDGFVNGFLNYRETLIVYGSFSEGTPLLSSSPPFLSPLLPSTPLS